MKTMNSILRLCAILCLFAGVAAFGIGCGDDNNEGGGDDCPSGQVSAEIGGVADCYETCEGDSDCSGGGTCQSTANSDTSVCVGGSGNNGADAGNNGTDGGDNNDAGLQCGTDEVAANPLGEGEACFATCTETADCSGNEECQELNDGSAICFETPTGDASCSDIIGCIGGCGEQDAQCQNECFFAGTADSQDTYETMLTCANTNCAQSQDPNCFRDNCQAEVDACAGCTGDELEINFQCATPCTEGGSECGASEECVQPYLGLTDQMVCSYSPDSFGEACTDASECGGPDPEQVAQGQGYCNTQAPGGECWAIGCNFGSQYGPGTGCGLEGICFEQPQQTGESVGLCQLLCREQSDCPRGETDDFSCRIVQEVEGERTGICGASCGSNADCTFQGTTGEIQGQCNHLGYCELPCDGSGDCADSGGTCDANDFCVFDEEPAE
jgi:hypothetical protein